MMRELGKTYLRSVREWGPVNILATGAVKGLCALAGRRCPDFAIWHLPRRGTVRARLPNGSELQLWSRRVDFIGNQVYWRGWTAYEPEVLPLFYALAERSTVILDVGANVGLYSLVASFANPSARIFSFEPHPDTRQRLSGNISRNRRPNIQVIPSAVSNATGSQLFYWRNVPLQNVPITSSLSRNFIACSGQESLCRARVDVTTIDHFCRERGIAGIGLAKLDIVGMEPKAIEGMRTTIERSRPHLVVQIEAHRGAGADLNALARTFGYNVFALDLDGPHFQRRLTVDERRTHYLFTSMHPAEVDALMKTVVYRLIRPPGGHSTVVSSPFPSTLSR